MDDVVYNDSKTRVMRVEFHQDRWNVGSCCRVNFLLWCCHMYMHDFDLSRFREFMIIILENIHKLILIKTIAIQVAKTHVPIISVSENRLLI